MPRKRFHPAIVPLARIAATLAVSLAMIAAPLFRAQGAAQQRTLPTQQQMPDLYGKTMPQASKLLMNLRPRFVIVDTIPASDPVGNGTIVKQNPAAGTPVPLGTTVTIGLKMYIRNPAPKLVKVPDFTGQDIQAARDALPALGLAPGSTSLRDAYNVPFRTVLEQKPLAGDAVPLQSPVSFLIASATTIVPDLKGAREGDVKSILAGYQLVLAGSKPIQSGDPPGLVLGQDVAPNTKVRKGSAVGIDVAVPVALVQVPYVSKQDIKAAQQAIVNAGLQVGVVEPRDQFDAPTGMVLDQKPGGGQQVKPGSPVDLWVASQWTEVPDITGKLQQDAKDLLARRFLRLRQSASVPSSEVGGTVLKQDLPAQYKAPKGTTVSVDIAVALAPVQVPNVVQKDVKAAEQTIANAGLKVGVVNKRDQFDAATGTVLEQKPGGGQPAQPGSLVELWIASEWTEVPDLTRLREADVKAVLDQRRLRPGHSAAVASTAVVGSVLSQNPPARAHVPKETTVSIVVAVAVPPVQVPDVVKQDVKAAQVAIESAGLKVGRVVPRDQYDAPTGIVLEQKPAPFQQVRRGSVVDLWVASEWTVVPDLTRLSEADVKAQLGARRLILGGVNRVISTAPAGTVIDQSPALQRRVRKESTVTVQLAQAAPPPPPVTLDSSNVPGIVGRTLAEARARVAAAGLFVTGVSDTANDRSRIVSQVPDSTARVRTGSAVTVTLAPPTVVNPAAPVPVPSLIGLTLPAARDQLNALGLILDVREPIRTREQPAKTVAAQEPSTGAQVPPGSTVAVNLARAPLPVLPVTGGFLAGALAVAGALAMTRRRSAALKDKPRGADKPVPPSPTLELIPTPVAADVQLRDVEPATPYSLTLVGELDQLKSSFALHSASEGDANE